MNQMEIKKSALACGESLEGAPADIPLNFTENPGGGTARNALLAVSESGLAQRLKTEVGRFISDAPVVVAPSLSRLRELAVASTPTFIFLDSDLLGEKPLSESVQQLAAIAPVLVLAPVHSQAEVAKLVALGNVEFIGRVGDYVPLAVALIARRLNGPAMTLPALANGQPPLTSSIGELFRHEINNPLTGILGNAELVLAHCEHLSPQEVQRLQTVVDLAVRLRESIRRISNAWERNPTLTNSH